MTSKRLGIVLVALVLCASSVSVAAAAAGNNPAALRTLSLPGLELRLELITPETPAPALTFEVAVQSHGAPPVEWRSVRLELGDGSSWAPSEVSFPGQVKPGEWVSGALSFSAPQEWLTGRVTLTIPQSSQPAGKIQLVWDLPQPEGAPAGGS